MNQINQNDKLSVNIQEYFNSINNDLDKIYSKAKEARKKGLDPSLDVEIPIAKDIADRVEGLIGPRGIGEKIRKYEKANLSRENVAFKIAEEICEDTKSIDSKEKEMIAEQALRTSLAVITESITAAPLEGIAKVKIKRNEDGSSYFAVYYAGPIRSAGGTAAGISILLADHIRKKLGLGKFQPTQREVERYLEEIELYNRVSHLQLPTTKDEQRFAAQQLPIEITGEPTDKVEVTGNRDLKRVETNRLRGGACLVFNDGLIGRSKKLHSRISQLGLEGWNWLEELINIHVKAGTFIDEGVSDIYDVDEGDEVETEEVPDAEGEVVSDVGYIKDVIGGRPVFAHPSEKGGFRIRYGRSRTTGLASMGIHPALMGVVNDFLACGTHVRTERPGKGAIVMPVDTIHPPIVKLKNGDVIKVQSYKEACEVRKDIEEILFLGDMLYGAGEFNQNNFNLVPSGYCEEWWCQELEESLMDIPDSKRNDLTKSLEKTISNILKNPFQNIPGPDTAIKLSKILDIPLHPEYTYHWNSISLEDFSLLRKYVHENFNDQNQQLGIPNEVKIKQILENLCIPHKLIDDFINLENHSFPLFLTLGIENKELKPIKNENGKIIETINSVSGIKIKAKCPNYTGARMGRPEKAKDRRMRPPVHMLFPVGSAGERLRDLFTASNKKEIEIELVHRSCPGCGISTNEVLCTTCEVPTVFVKRCLNCNYYKNEDLCPKCGREMVAYRTSTYPLESRVNQAKKTIGGPFPKNVKGVKKLMNKNKVAEAIEKGILRAKHGIFVYRDGTIRFDATDAVLTHFKPKEIGVTVQQLHKIGYSVDIYGKPLENSNQTTELKIQDIVLNIEGGKHLVKVAGFIDELLEKFYKLPKFYNAKKPSDLIGQIIIGLAPHTSAGIVGRIIGFTKAKVNFAHPYWHAAKRRNCDGDEDSILLALDAFLNFSKHYLPKIRGGQMDAPLILVANINPHEVDDESHNVDTSSRYPLSFYEETLKRPPAKAVLPLIDMIRNRLNDESAYEGFMYSHETSNIFAGPESNTYKNLTKMEDKVNAQLHVAELIRAVNIKDVASRIVVNHFIPDLIGNLRRFGSQKIRCTKCNMTYRRVPLSGICINCKNKNLNLTVYEKSITKYFSMAKNLVEKYNLSEYLKNRLEIIKHNVDSLFVESGFVDEKEKRKINGEVKLSDFFVKYDSEEK